MAGFVEEQPTDYYRWKTPCLAVLVGSALLFLLYRSTLLSMVSTWNRSETFAHGYLIFPISAFLIWRHRKILIRLSPQPDLRALAGIVLMGFAWIIANLAEVQVIQQFILIVQFILQIWAILGFRIVREMAFPLAFLFFCVPFGDFLIPGMMRFTADFTVEMIKWTGIPVYRDGNTFSLPSGNWSVVEACSGLRYLIASLTLGCLYAYLNYHRLWRRIAFIVVSLVLPVIANGLRAFMIVMIGHFSEMKFAVGVDHLIYGWLFFGVVILFMVWIGRFWSDMADNSTDSAIGTEKIAEIPTRNRRFVLVGALAIGLAAIGPIQAFRIAAATSSSNPSPVLGVPESKQEWSWMETESGRWRPDYQGASTEITASYSGRSGKLVTVFLFYYRNQKQGRELVNSSNSMVGPRNTGWHLLDAEKIQVKLPDRSFQANQSRLGSQRKNLLVWEWYWVGNEFVSNDVLAKLLEVKAKLLGRNTDSAAVVVSLEYSDSVASSADGLRQFVEEMAPSIESSLHTAAQH